MNIQSRLITAEDVAGFKRDGCVAIRNVLTADQLASLEGTFSHLLEGAVDVSSYFKHAPEEEIEEGASMTRAENWLHDDFFRDFMFNSQLPLIAADMMESREVRLYEDLLIYRGASSDSPTLWHQDSATGPMKGSQQCSIWFSLEPLTVETGALRFVKGSHLGPTYIPFVSADKQEALARDMRFFDGGPLPAVDNDPERFPVKTFDVDPGDVIIFHPQCLHGAFGTPANYPRRSLSIRYFGDDVVWEPKEAAFHQWIRNLKLPIGEPVRDDHFPRLWPH